MSKCFYIESKDGFINLEAVKENLQNCMNEGFTVKLDEYERSEGEGGCFYIEGEAARGIHVFKEDDNIVVKINVLCNYPDYIIAKIILDMLNQVLEKNVIDEEDNIVNVEDYFADEKIQEYRETDAKMVFTMLQMANSTKQDYVHIPGVVRITYFGKDILTELKKYENESAEMLKIFDSVINHVQYELPEYDMPGAALIQPKGSEDEADMIKIRMMFEGTDYILQDYEYLLVGPINEEEGPIFIDNNDLIDICTSIYKKNSKFELADDLTVVFPKMNKKDWQKFVELAREKNHKELLDCVPAAKTVNLTPDYNSENDEEDETSNQCHGDHWDCVFTDPEKEFGETVQTAIENGELVGQTETDYLLEEENTEKSHGKVFEIEYSKQKDDALSVRVVIAASDDSNQLMSMYPVVRDGTIIPITITEIKEWTNGLEAWIEGELSDGRPITFFDADYALNKEKYEVGKSYDFIIGCLSYTAEEPESKGFKFEGQQAIDFKAKMGEEPEYDEDGKVKPIEFSTASLCAFMQAGHAPDEVEFISTIEEVQEVQSFDKIFWKYDVIYRAEGDTETLIPMYTLKTDENKSLEKADQIQGVAWITGYLAK